MTQVSLDHAALAALLPLHASLSATGHVRGIGHTLARLRPAPELLGRRVLEVFEVRRPRSPGSFAELRELAGRKLALQFRDGCRTALKGLLVPVPDGGAILSLSLGIGAVGAVARHGLTARDFAPTDLTVEMLYLVEAKTAAMDESRRLNQRLQHERAAAKEQAVTDPLTGLKNRRGLEEALSRLASAGTPYGLIHIDLDRFKAINDTLGHDAGDAMLCAAARAMQAEVREHDIAARVGGDEFVLVFPGSSDPARLTAAAERMIARIEAPVVLKGESCRISASAGIALSHRTRLADAAAILREADAALYEAKRAGRGHARIAS